MMPFAPLLIALLAAPKPLTPKQVYAAGSKSVLMLVGMGSDHGYQGSGVAVSPSHVVTNWHVVKDADEIGVRTPGGDVVRAILVTEDTEHDLAMLRVLGLRLTPAKLEREVPQPGERVYAIGAPQGLQLTLSEGLISGMRQVEKASLIQTSTPISQGSSGGALLNERAQLVGVTVASLTEGQNLNFAVPATAVASLMESGTSARGATAWCEADGELKKAVEAHLDAREKAAVEAALQRYPCGGEAQRPFTHEARVKGKTLADAQTALDKGDFALAQDRYRDFLRQWPADSGDAHFGLAETYFASNAWRDALIEYRQVVSGFPALGAAPRAYLKAAVCFQQLEMDKEARITLSKLLDTHPKSEEGVLAKKVLDRLAELDRAYGQKRSASFIAMQRACAARCEGNFNSCTAQYQLPADCRKMKTNCFTDCVLAR